MATSKTLTPTNVTIQIPEFTDQPDQRVNSNCIDKEADAINALNGNIASILQARNASGVVTCPAGGTVDVDFTLNAAFTNNPQELVIACIGSTNLFGITVRSLSGTSCNIRVHNFGSTAATDANHTFRIIGFSAGINN